MGAGATWRRAAGAPRWCQCRGGALTMGRRGCRGAGGGGGIRRVDPRGVGGARRVARKLALPPRRPARRPCPLGGGAGAAGQSSVEPRAGALPAPPPTPPLHRAEVVWLWRRRRRRRRALAAAPRHRFASRPCAYARGGRPARRRVVASVWRCHAPSSVPPAPVHLGHRPRQLLRGRPSQRASAFLARRRAPPPPSRTPPPAELVHALLSLSPPPAPRSPAPDRVLRGRR